MDIILYSTASKPNTIGKVKSVIKTISGQAIEPLDIIAPTIKVKIDNAILSANYVYIAKFSRFYFIKSITADNGFMHIGLTVDPLDSFKSQILAYNGILNRQEYDYNLYLEDSELSAYSNSIITYKNFPNSPLDYSIASGEKKFVMITTSNTED